MSQSFPKYFFGALIVTAPLTISAYANAQTPSAPSASPAPSAPPPATAPSASAAPPTTPAPPTTAAPSATAPASPPPSDADTDVTVDAEPSTKEPSASPGTAVAPAAPPAAGVTPAPSAAAPAKAATDAAPADEKKAEEKKKEAGPGGIAGTGIVLSGYFQGQYESHQDSADQLRQGGALLNQNRFLLRRGRIRFARDWDYAAVLVELDGNTNRGPTVRVQKAELSLVYGRSKEKGVPPIAQLTIGQFDLPFGFDLVQSPRTRWFMERSTVSRALWPGEPDMGVRLSGGISFARYAFAVTNGEPIDEKSGFGLQDPNANKDFTGRVGAETKTLEDKLIISGGISYNNGKGFHAGTDATKDTVTWSDTNADGSVQANEISGSPRVAAQSSVNFTRWAVGADLQVQLKTMLGWSILTGELINASNLDRNLFIADPLAGAPVTNDPVKPGSITPGPGLRELGYYIAFTQEITPYGVVGIRYDAYDPNSDNTDQAGGKPLPRSQKITTVSPLVGLALPDRARLIFQYDHISDLLARDSRGVPTDFKNDQWTLRLQVML